MGELKLDIRKKTQRVPGSFLSLLLVGFLITGCAGSLEEVLGLKNEVRGGNAVTHPSKIIHGETTKNEILTYYGKPDTIKEEENAFIYIWEEKIQNVGKLLFGRTREDEPDKVWAYKIFYILFDQEDVVKGKCQHWEHEIVTDYVIHNELEKCLAKERDL